MYDYLVNKDKNFLMRMRAVCSDLINQLVQLINSENDLFVEANLIGSGARHLETQNENEPIDLDYNLVILDVNGIDWNDCKTIKNYVKECFDAVLNKNGWGNCKDSTSVLSTEKRQFKKGNKSLFSIDLAIICEDKESWYRLIHKKTGFASTDEYYWNEGKDSKGLNTRVNWIKKKGLWHKVRDAYLDKKNMYLKRGDKNHPSFNCYIEAVNEVFYANK